MQADEPQTFESNFVRACFSWAGEKKECAEERATVGSLNSIEILFISALESPCLRNWVVL